MKYLVALIFSYLVIAKDFGDGLVSNIFLNFVTLGHRLQDSPADTLATIAGGMLPILLIWFGVTWLIKKFKSQQSTPLAQTSTKQASPPVPPAYSMNADAPQLAIAKAVMPPTQSTTPYLITAAPSSQVSADENLWEQALNEYDGSARKQGLWARLFSEAQGNEAITKANYLRIRVDEMQQSITLEKERIETDRKIKIAHEIAISETKLQEQRAYDALPKGVCPNCKKTLLLLSTDKCTKCSALFGLHSAFKISEISKQEQLNALSLLAQNGNSLTEYETYLLNSGSDQHRGLSKRLSDQTDVVNS